MVRSRFGLAGVLTAGLATAAYAVVFPNFTTNGLSVYQAGVPPYLDHAFNTLVVRGDLDGDGRDDVVVGGTNYFDNTLKTPVRIFANPGTGTLVDRTSLLHNAPGPIEFYQPQGLIADFNGDGRGDLVLFDLGRRVRAVDGGYFGGRPMAFYSKNVNGAWVLKYSAAVSQAIIAFRMTLVTSPRNCGGPKYFWWNQAYGECDIWNDGSSNELSSQSNDAFHSKFQSAGDVDGDGDIDIFAEGGGAFSGQPYGQLFLNDGAGSFVIKADRISPAVLHGGGGTGSWRHSHNHLVDIDGDGDRDLVMGKLGNIYSATNTDHHTLFSKVLLNDGSGNFPAVIELPNPVGFIQGGPGDGATPQATVVNAIASSDVDQNGLLDLVLVHTRGTDGAHLDTTPWTATGRYVQLFLQTSLLVFKDETVAWFGDQSAHGRVLLEPDFEVDPQIAPFFTHNFNYARQARFLDVDVDGDLDLVMEKIEGNLHSSYSPLIYLRDGNQFVPYSPSALQYPNPYYLTGAGLGFVNLDQDQALEFVMAGPFAGPFSAPAHGLYRFFQ